jgi:hypothetical protein
VLRHEAVNNCLFRHFPKAVFGVVLRHDGLALSPFAE